MTPYTVAHQTLLSIGFSREEYWSELPFPFPMHACMHAKSLQSCPILCDPKDSSPPGPSVHEILQARILEWVATSFSIYGTVYRKKDRKSSQETINTLKGNCGCSPLGTWRRGGCANRGVIHLPHNVHMVLSSKHRVHSPTDV